MRWYQEEDEEEEDIMFSPAILARRASESWIVAPPVEVVTYFAKFIVFSQKTNRINIFKNNSQPHIHYKSIINNLVQCWIM